MNSRIPNTEKWTEEQHIEAMGFTIITSKSKTVTIMESMMLLELSFRAAQRLRENKYQPWSVSGGGAECEHGYHESFFCPKCDEMTVKEMEDLIAKAKVALLAIKSSR